MALLPNERAFAKKRIKQFRELDKLYELIEWGGLSSVKWQKLHELEKELAIPGDAPTCICDTVTPPLELTK